MNRTLFFAPVMALALFAPVAANAAPPAVQGNTIIAQKATGETLPQVYHDEDMMRRFIETTFKVEAIRQKYKDKVLKERKEGDGEYLGPIEKQYHLTVQKVIRLNGFDVDEFKAIRESVMNNPVVRFKMDTVRKSMGVGEVPLKYKY